MDVWLDVEPQIKLLKDDLVTEHLEFLQPALKVLRPSSRPVRRHAVLRAIIRIRGQIIAICNVTANKLTKLPVKHFGLPVSERSHF